MTLPLQTEVLEETKLAARVSPHAYDSWTWSLTWDDEEFDPPNRSGYYLKIEKGSLAMELVNQALNYLPRWLVGPITDSSRYREAMARNVAEQLRLPVDDQIAMLLCRDFWMSCTGPDVVEMLNEEEEDGD